MTRSAARGPVIVLGTRNEKKVIEIRRMLTDLSVHWEALSSDAPEVEEIEPTFEGNARRKAEQLSAWTGGWVLADDSGLEVDALDGAPGVLSHRYAGEPPDDDANNAKLLREMEHVPSASRGAQFRCALSLAYAGHSRLEVDGLCRAPSATSPEGEHDFG